MKKTGCTAYCLLVIIVALCSCGGTNEEKILDWHQEMKEEILSNADVKADSVWENIDLNEGWREKREYHDGSIISLTIKDVSGITRYAVQYAVDTNFALVTEYCPPGYKTYEGIEYQHRPYGLATWYYCKGGKVMEQGLRFKFRKTGAWKKYNPDGSIQSEIVYKEKIPFKSFPKPEE